MRMHINLDEALVRELDALAEGNRTAFIVKAIEHAIDERRRWNAILGALGSIPDSGHDWDEDPAAWTRAQRRSDRRRVG